MSCSVKILVHGRLPAAFRTMRAEIRRAAAYFAARSHARVSGAAWHEVTVHLVGDRLSDEIHRAVIGEPGVTDVVTQAYDAIPPEAPGLYGEVFVNAEQAVRAAPRRKGWSVGSELLLYIAHGMDHLSGADDHAEAGYRAMRRRELGWIRAFMSKS